MSLQEDEAYNNRIRESLQANLGIMEEQIGSYVEPKDVKAQLIVDYHIQKQRVETLDNLTPTNQLKALEDTEQWYKDKNLEFPNPEWLEQRRIFWSNKQSDRT